MIIKIRKLSQIYTFLVLIIALAMGFTPKPDSPLAKRQHPRMHITLETIPYWRTVLSEKYKTEYQDYVNWAAEMNDNDSYNILSEAGHDPLRAVMVHQAFIAAIGNVPGISYPISLDKYAERAINSLIRRLKAGDNLSYVAALTYDWTYNFMTSEQRKQIADMVLERPVTHKVFSQSLSDPLFKPEQMFSSKYFEGCYAWYIGLAFWGDGLIDAEADQSLDSFAQEMLNYGYLDAHNFVAGNDGGWSEWIGYSSWHPRTHFLNIDAWFTATGEDYISNPSTVDGNAIANYPKFMYYALDPHKYFNEHYSYVRTGIAETSDPSFEHRSMREQMYVLPRILNQAGLSDQAGLVRHLIETYDVKWFNYKHHYLWGFLGLHRSVAEVTPQQMKLPESLWSRNLGVFIARTGFDNPADGVFMVMDGHFRFDGHGGADDTPGFALAKFGELLNTRNVAHRNYGNLDSYPGARKNNVVYFEGDHTLSHQSMDSPDELEKASKGEGDFDWGGIEQITRRDEDYYHVRVNRSRMFKDGVAHVREYVWLPGENPQTDSDFLVVFDRTSAPDKAEWVYHVPWKPEAFNYDSDQDMTTGSGSGDRIGTAYIGSNIIIKEFNGLGGERDGDMGKGDYVGGAGAHGVLFAKTLVPEQARVEVTRVADFNNDVLKRQHRLAIKSHRWQVSVKPVEFNSDQRFLHVFQMADANKVNQMVPVTAIRSGKAMQGVFIQKEAADRPNYVVLFFNEDSLNKGVVTYNINGDGKTVHVITGLIPNMVYQIKEIANGQIKTKIGRSEQDIQKWDYKGVAENPTEGVLYFESDLSGSQTFSISSGSRDDQPPAKPQGLKLKTD
ncbi:MAG: hypothetical protein GXO77_02560 [Calditrichaeota bacterium]|nr:hypothetical protein [Calditrichota bacterium]